VNPELEDRKFMGVALRAALRGFGRTAPNPAVGAVVVQEGKVVGVGHHAEAGAPHAEIQALRGAGEKARGARMYVTLEPCCHQGRTPPCTEAILAAGVAEVVFAVSDPSPHCAGGGEAQLVVGGVRVRKGILREESLRLNAAFFKRLKVSLPFVTAKWAMTVDGKTATPTGDSRWITSAPARALVHRFRSRVGAVLVGIGTVLKDDPLLTSRLPGRRQPLRVVVDSMCRTPLGSQLVETAGEVPVLIVHGTGAPGERVRALQERGLMTLEVQENPNGLDLEAMLRGLAEGSAGTAEVDHVLLEGGGELTASMIRGGFVDHIEAFIAPKIAGGREAKTPVEGAGVEAIASAVPMTFFHVRRIGSDILMEGDLRRGNPDQE
jgi:diaminohydroxyphosphoribosylaminopyrimidine deaminase/5-amino-6-(5-phosphoribosylamino)uracil reductase